MINESWSKLLFSNKQKEMEQQFYTFGQALRKESKKIDRTT